MERRPEVEWFADAMEAALRANDHKPGWKNDDPWALQARLFEEAKELQRAVREREGAEKILKEAADVANFAMMVADVCRVKRFLPGIGREDGTGER
jgi:NTP pyrophosphatase (non-canonical NTP hydrolase)